MKRRFEPLHRLEGNQALAADPGAHAALSASAGTGKTQVLTARVLRLLLRGVDPSAILCLTFTKSGAAEMANRIGDRLARWVRLPDHLLSHELFALGEGDRSPLALEQARRLFARVLESPGGLRIQTIHAFAQTLLASFPAEADIAPGFQPIEGRAEQELARRTLADLLTDAEASGDDRLNRDIAALSMRLGEEEAVAYLMRCAHAAEAIAAIGDPASIESALRTTVGLPDGDIEEHIANECTDGRFDRPLFDRLIRANQAWGTAKAGVIVTNLTAWLAAAPDQRSQSLDDLNRNLITKLGVPCKPSLKQMTAEPDYEALVARFGEWHAGLMSLRRACALVAVQAAGLRAGAAFSTAYATAKRAAGVADFDDLIAWTRRLFARDGMGEWVRYKLDQRTDHVLLDEAQDSNSGQWAIFDELVSEFFAGASATERRWRTLFMVGDFKQAIYGFQGSDPAEFNRMRTSVRERAQRLIDAENDADLGGERFAREFRDLSIVTSFRSAPAILDAVDAVVRDVGFEQMGLPERPPIHQANHAAWPGYVDVWPPFEAPEAADEEDGEEGWLSDTDRLYATHLADEVSALVAEAPTLQSTKRALCPGDIMILVRSRKELASLLVARLFAAGVPVAGIDRLHLQKPLAVRDLISAIAFAVQPLDDLNLAGLLVSPLMGWDQQQLYDLAEPRGKATLWRALQQAAKDEPFAEETVGKLLALLNIADFVTPARFLETILSGPLDGRRALLSRLGEAARDPIDELLAAALEFERSEIASLDRFLAWFERGDVEIKRDTAAPANAVRVMTVHAAKGLEAPVVILADATADPARLGGTRSFDLPLNEGRDKVPVVRPRKEEMVSPFSEVAANAKRQETEEHWRLLYVAMTRAAERLIVAGVMPRKLSEDSWNRRVGQALAGLGATADDRGRLRWSGSVAPRAMAARAAKTATEPPPLPAWLRLPAPPEPRPPRPLAPSSLGDDRDVQAPPSSAQIAAARRGTLLHALFERLPGVEAEHRRRTALHWLEQSGAVHDAALRAEIADSAIAVIGAPEFADLFAPGALAEAPIAATLPDGRVIAGTVDRLCIGEKIVRFVDFKTGRSAPSSLADVPPSHVAQMAAYGEALRTIFPGRRIEAALLYTSAPRLIALPG